MEPLILGFDTSAAHCAAALLSGDRILSERVEEMKRGQAERLVPMLEEMLAEQGVEWSDLTGLGVGTGPGNFTGLRIAVALARGLALALDIPAHGITGFESLALDAPRPVLATLPAPRAQLYGQLFTDAGPSEAKLFPEDEVPPALLPEGTKALGAIDGTLPANPAIAIARIAATREEESAPAPFYLRPADAAPPRDAPPRIVP